LFFGPNKIVSLEGHSFIGFKNISIKMFDLKKKKKEKENEE
jgi:hypothetical protein